jgi:LysR family glycine cleavage system transcriptional activator
MRRLPPLNALQVFEVAARHGSFTRAADELCLTQGAVSRQILALEGHFGFPLFRRQPKGLVLTVEGEMLLPVVRDSFGRIADVSARLTRQHHDLALKVSTCAMRWVLPKIMQFQIEYPDIQIQLTTTWQHSVDFALEPFDAAVVYGPDPGSHVEALRLFEEKLTPVCAPETLASKPLQTPEDLAGHRLLHPTRDHRDWAQWLAYAGVDTIDPNSGQNFETLDLAMHAAAQGFGVAIGDVSLVGEDVGMKRLVQPFDITLTTGQSYFLVYPDEGVNAQKVALLREWLTRFI